jgi:hypothetical protein
MPRARGDRRAAVACAQRGPTRPPRAFHPSVPPSRVQVAPSLAQAPPRAPAAVECANQTAPRQPRAQQRCAAAVVSPRAPSRPSTAHEHARRASLAPGAPGPRWPLAGRAHRVAPCVRFAAMRAWRAPQRAPRWLPRAARLGALASGRRGRPSAGLRRPAPVLRRPARTPPTPRAHVAACRRARALTRRSHRAGTTARGASTAFDPPKLPAPHRRRAPAALKWCPQPGKQRRPAPRAGSTGSRILCRL